jgi:SAM-dependent MidA family methyltransferase
LTFATFMDLALYHPTYGYYSTLRAPPGPRGDFFTSPEAHPAFGALVARQLLEVWQRLGQPAPFVVEEWGAGSGRLAADLLTAAPLLAPGFGASLRYVLVERSAALRRAQERLLRPWLAQVRWLSVAESGPPTPQSWGALVSHSGSPPALGGPVGASVVLAHELLDAFAVHRVVQRSGVLHERYVDLEADGFREIDGPLSTAALAAYFDRLGLLPPEGALAEVNLGALAWLHSVAARLTRGVVLIVDYAHPAEVLYSTRYPRGTLRTYHHHAWGENPYVRVGQQDLTTHLDLTSLLLEGRAAGLAPLGVARQRDFLLRLGLAAYEGAVRAADWRAAEQRASLTALETLTRATGLGRLWVIGFGRGLHSPLHGLMEDAQPLADPVLAGFLRSRLGWGRRS